MRVAIEPNVESSFADQVAQTAGTDTTAGLQLLEFEPQDSSFALMHGRKWHVLSKQPKFAVLRMVDEGQTIAQCNIREIAALPKEKRTTLESFKLDVVKGIANSRPQIVSATESTNPAGVRVYRGSSRGQRFQRGRAVDLLSGHRQGWSGRVLCVYDGLGSG